MRMVRHEDGELLFSADSEVWLFVRLTDCHTWLAPDGGHEVAGATADPDLLFAVGDWSGDVWSSPEEPDC